MMTDRNRRAGLWVGMALISTLILVLASPAGARQVDRPMRPIASIYRVPPIEKLAAGKVRTIRAAFFITTSRRDMPLVTFLRPPGEEPRVEVRYARSDDGGPARAPLTAPISGATWDALVADGVNFDRTLTPKVETPSKDGMTEIVICTDGWTVTMEAVDEDGGVRRLQEGTCDHGLAAPYGFALAKAAVAALPACATLIAGNSSEPSLLAACGMLEGDRAAAAKAFNVWTAPGFAGAEGPEYAPIITEFFSADAVVIWPGEAPARGRVKAAQSWAAHIGKMDFYPEHVFGETPDRVRMEGVIEVQKPQGDNTLVPATLIWSDHGYGFQVFSLVIK